MINLTTLMLQIFLLLLFSIIFVKVLFGILVVIKSIKIFKLYKFYLCCFNFTLFISIVYNLWLAYDLIQLLYIFPFFVVVCFSNVYFPKSLLAAGLKI